MLAIVAAVLFFIALLLQLTKTAIGIGTDAIVTAGLMCVALHMAGIGSALRTRTGARSGRWSFRR
jgi:hypothetical protein